MSGATATGPIDVYSRTSVAGVLTTFQNTLLGGGKVASVATQEASEGLMQNAVKKDPAGIGFLSDYFALAKGVNAVAYNGHRLQRRQRRRGHLPRRLRLLRGDEGPAKGQVEAFIYWVQTSSTAKKIIESNWIPLGKIEPAVKTR